MCSDYSITFIGVTEKCLPQDKIGPAATVGSLFIYSDKIGYTSFSWTRVTGSKGKLLETANE